MDDGHHVYDSPRLRHHVLRTGDTGHDQTSAVFIFATPVQNAPTAVVLANGSGTARTIDQNDTATITFSGQLNATSICSTWTNTGHADP